MECKDEQQSKACLPWGYGIPCKYSINSYRLGIKQLHRYSLCAEAKDGVVLERRPITCHILSIVHPPEMHSVLNKDEGL